MYFRELIHIRGGADKSLAPPGRKKATATALGIYPTYSPKQAKYTFLFHCFKQCKPLKKKFRRLSVQPGLRGSNDLRVGRKIVPFQLFFQSREQVVVRWGQIRGIGWVIEKLEAQVGQFLLGCKCPVSRSIVVQEQDPLGDLNVAFFLQNILQFLQQRWVILRVESLALWKIITGEAAVVIPKKSRREIFQWIFALGIFWGSVSRYAATSLIVALSPSHSDIIRFRGFVHGHQSRQEITWIWPKKFQNLLRRMTPLTFLIRIQAFQDPLRGELPHVQIFMNDGPNPLTWDAQLLSYWFSRNLAVFQD